MTKSKIILLLLFGIFLTGPILILKTDSMSDELAEVTSLGGLNFYSNEDSSL